MFAANRVTFWVCGQQTGLHLPRAALTPFSPAIQTRSYLRLYPSIAAVLQAPVASGPSKDPTVSADDTITVNGFVRSVRRHKHICFAAVGDGSTTQPLQVVLTPAQAENLSTGASISISGQWQPSPRGKEQQHELLAENLRVLGEADPTVGEDNTANRVVKKLETQRQTYPLQKKYQTPDYLRTIPHLRSRIPFNSLLLRLRSRSIEALTRYFAKNDIWQTHPPIITSSDCEGAGEVFTVTARHATRKAKIPQSERQDEPFFRSPKYLTVSSQLHLEALAQSVGRVWTLSPTFRAEGSDTSRHLSEFYMLEAELSFANELAEIMNLVEHLLKYLCGVLSSTHFKEELISAMGTGDASREEGAIMTESKLESRWDSLLRRSDQGVERMWPRITYSKALQHLQEAVEMKRATFEHPLGWSLGLQSEHEKFITEDIGKGVPVFVTDYPREIKAFYMAPSPTLTYTHGPAPQGPTVACFDLLMPDIGEVAGGSMRENRLPELLESMRRHGLVKPSLSSLADGNPIAPNEDLGSLKWYAELRRWGSVPHGGFGLGFDRLLSYLSGVPNVRDVATFPRWPGRCDC
ncbi:MAG: asparaginyl-tRNA synthetase [Candelina mexicana]|nr:MAG: asparaginyl-tRNA synthetase [Candelina mexicana]